MIGEEYKKSEHNQWAYPKTSSKCQQSERMCRAKKEKTKALRKNMTTHRVKNVIQGDTIKVVRLILKLKPISEHSQMETKKKE